MKRKSEHNEFSILAMKRMNEIVEEFGDGSQQRIADRTGVNKGSISSYCNGRNVPNNLTAKKICEPFGLSPLWLMGFSDIKYADDEANLREVAKRIETVREERQRFGEFMSDKEVMLIKSYRNADDRTKSIVDIALNISFEPDKIAAHESTDIEATDEMKTNDMTKMDF